MVGVGADTSIGSADGAAKAVVATPAASMAAETDAVIVAEIFFTALLGWTKVVRCYRAPSWGVPLEVRDTESLRGGVIRFPRRQVPAEPNSMKFQ
jgi:hypothetical protein